MKKLNKILKILLVVFPAAFYFSYFPIISLGANETMNFELSIPLIVLVLFDVLAFFALVKEKSLSAIFRKWWWLLFPAFVTLSMIWTQNLTRAILTCGIMWLVYFAVFALVQLKEKLVDEKTLKMFWRVFFGAGILACAWCVVQCVLDVMYVPRENSLLCAGCVSQMFGFPHPSGFAIEPQFMGNLLLAPAVVSAWLMLQQKSCKRAAILFVIFASTIFLTFSRGAIFAFGLAMIFMTAIVLKKKKERVTKIKRVGLTWVLALCSFLFTLNLQGILTEVGPTNDNYMSGVAKVINHLSLGKIDIRASEKKASNDDGNIEKTDIKNGEKSEATFDGYVAESTDTRVRLTKSAITIWRKDLKNMLIGVGIGGAGQALYNNEMSPAPKEIVQNEYASLLLEVGVVGFLLFAMTIILIIRVIMKSPCSSLLLTLVTTYGFTLLFFSGFANALQIYLMPAILMVVMENKNKKTCAFCLGL